jgi:hypothetical protein
MKCSFCDNEAHYDSIIGRECHAHFEESSRQVIEINKQRPFDGNYRVEVESKNPLKLKAVKT